MRFNRDGPDHRCGTDEEPSIGHRDRMSGLKAHILGFMDYTLCGEMDGNAVACGQSSSMSHTDESH